MSIGQPKKFIILGLMIMALVFLIMTLSYLGISFKREIVITATGPAIPTTDLGHFGTVFPFSKTKEKVNFLFLGIAGENNSAPLLTDTIIIINSTPQAEDPIAISVPRDLLVKYPEKNYYTKINALYKFGGVNAIATGVNEVTGLEADYYLIMDLEGVKKIINKLDGIDVNVKEDIYDPAFPAAYDSYETFSLAKGEQHLDGETALKYIRTRNQSGGDFSRIERQQQVINVIKDKILALNFILNFPKILGLWNILQDNAYTNIEITDIKYAWNLIKKAGLEEIKFNTITPPLVIPGTTELSGDRASVLLPSTGLNNYNEIKNYITNLIK